MKYYKRGVNWVTWQGEKRESSAPIVRIGVMVQSGNVFIQLGKNWTTTTGEPTPLLQNKFIRKTLCLRAT